MLTKIAKLVGIDPNKREVERLSKIVAEINALEADYEALSDEALRGKTEAFRARIAESLAGETDEKERRRIEQDMLTELLPEAFAAVREASKRTLGQRHYDVQLLGGIVLHEGKIAEMRTGEGKTLVATLPTYLNALLARGTHVVTVNDYLARRDARWMAPIYNLLGMSVGVLQMASRTENGQMAFLVDLKKEAAHEDQDKLRLVLRTEAYKADITYGTNSEFGFDYLRDNLGTSPIRVQRGHYFAIVDEVDNILIDEARTPLIISGPAHDDTETYYQMAEVVNKLNPEDYEVNEKDRGISLTEIGEMHVEELLGIELRDPDRPEDVTPEQARLMGFLEQALRAQFLFHQNKDYLIQGGKVIIIDEFTGRLMPGRRWSDGLHQAVEAKHHVKVEPENVTYATITIQNYFRMYQKLSGMSGTAVTEGEEFWKIYKLDVLPIPTNLEYQASRNNSPYVSVEAKDPEGYKYTYYARRNDGEKQPLFYRRKDYPDVVYRSEETKGRAITKEILFFHVVGRPQLVGTTSVEHSERLSKRLTGGLISRLALVLLLRSAYLKMKGIQESEQMTAIQELHPLYAPLEEIEISDVRRLAKELGVPFSANPQDPENIKNLMAIFDLPDGCEDRLITVLQGGIPHEVLNARKHDEESKIIAKAGAFGAVTIATNMAGRGVDIKLGGELDEEILGRINRLLERNKYDAFNMTNEERYEALQKVNTEDIGIQEEEAIKAFYQYLQEMEQVRQLGGLHVVGSERHEARRIDNQLRGRAARQGDPGSSRFYLSFDDELMRLFGGQQVEGLLSRFNIEESLPIENGLVGRLVEQSQERVEGSNFDVRKHLLEYDDVLNAQRKRIYEQRDRAFTKEDLSDDLTEILRTELQQRVPQALKDAEGPWQLVAYLDQVQPSIYYENLRYPSFSESVLIEELLEKRAEGATISHLRENLLSLAGRALQSQNDHLLHSFRKQLEQAGETLETQIQERLDSLDAFIESVKERQENGELLRSQDLAPLLTETVRLSGLRLSGEQVRLATEDPDELRAQLSETISSYLQNLAINRISSAIKARVDDTYAVHKNQFQEMDWQEITEQFLKDTEVLLEARYDRLLGDGKAISQSLDPLLDKMQEYPTDEGPLVDLLEAMMQGQQHFYNAKHQKQQRYVRRLEYQFLAGQMMQDLPVPEITDRVLVHLERAREVLHEVRGMFAWTTLVHRGAVVDQLDAKVKTRFAEKVGDERFEEVRLQPLSVLTPEEQEQLTDLFGWLDLNEATRQLLVSVISDRWVDYLTQVEALRVSIGLEAYAQRDPLVMYKSRASEMFQQLLADIRLGVISQLFTFRTPSHSLNLSEAPQVEGAAADGGANALAAEAPQPQPANGFAAAAGRVSATGAGVGTAVGKSSDGGGKSKKRRHH